MASLERRNEAMKKHVTEMETELKNREDVGGNKIFVKYLTNLLLKSKSILLRRILKHRKLVHFKIRNVHNSVFMNTQALSSLLINIS
jgi:hypothetical protein